MAAVHVKVDAEHGKSHHDHWNDALDQALRRASELGRKDTFDVELRYWATIHVTNPGRVLSYNVSMDLTP
jgi:hypothetical protein